MKNKSELNKMTKKNIILYIEGMDSIIPQSEHDISNIRRAAGKMRKDIFDLELDLEDRISTISIVDNFLNKL